MIVIWIIKGALLLALVVFALVVVVLSDGSWGRMRHRGPERRDTKIDLAESVRRAEGRQDGRL